MAQEPAAPVDAPGWINKGVQEYKSARYTEAVESFQKAVELNPNDMAAHLYLGTAWMMQYIPGGESAENSEMARQAEAEFTRVFQVEPNNLVALNSLASLMYQQAQGTLDAEQKSRKLDESASWYERVIAVDPANKEANYSLGVIQWAKWYPAWMRARAELGMRPEDPGPLRDPARQQLKQKYTSMLEQGISYLERRCKSIRNIQTRWPI